jgi:hemerythrin
MDISKELVSWSDDYSVSFDIVDGQHKKLVEMTNELFLGCARDPSSADVAFMKAIRDALEYAQVHFFTEEKYMKLAEYPGLPEHKKEHEAFVKTVIGAVKSFENDTIDPIELARYLKNWLLNHIAVSDKQCAPYFMKLPENGQEKHELASGR